MDPMVEMKFRWKDTAKLCEVNTGNDTKCLCKLSDEDSRGPRVTWQSPTAFGWFGFLGLKQQKSECKNGSFKSQEDYGT